MGVLGGAAVLGVLAWRWTREPEPEPAPQRWSLNGHPLAPDEERRLDEELARFEGERIAAAFAAGLVSIAFPCVLPLVPGYLSAITAVEVDRLGERGVARRVIAASVPFALGFTVVFVLLGAGAAALGGWVDPETRTKIAGFVLVVLGLAFMGLLPWPERMLAPGALTRARASGSRALLGAASPSARRRASASCSRDPRAGGGPRTVCAAASCSRPTRSGSRSRSSLIGIAFTRAMAAFRWVRDHYDWIRYLSGATLVALGLLLFFNRDWWLRVLLNRALDALGLGGQL